jgi:hypothetical protein
MKLLVYDIETLKEDFLLVVYDIECKKIVSCTVNKEINEIEKIQKITSEYRDFYWIGFNNLRFDSQVIQYIISNYENWMELSWKEITHKIHRKSQDVIDDANYGIFPEYREYELFAKQIDLFTIWHFNNENRRTSLKALQFYMNWENIEEMPINHDKENLSSEELIDIYNYCVNDVMSTHQFFKEYTLGETDNSLYKGKNKIADRFAMKQEFNLDCLNWDDVKIGAEWNKLDYVTLTGKSPKDLQPPKVVHFYGKRFKNFFPEWCKFQTKELQNFVKNLGATYVLNEKQEFKYVFNNELTATIAKGGVHSCETGRWLIPEEDEEYWQIDIGLKIKLWPN